MAYRARHSTETALLSVHNDLVCSIDDGKVSVLVLLDLSSAFDTVDHEILLSLLTQRFCVRDTAYDWCRSYLSSRIQSFNFADQQTGPYPLDCSVPQGSVLGPLKFIAYTENGVDVIKHHDVNVHLYADDTQLYDCCYPHNIAKTRQRMSHCTADFSAWCASHRLQLNADKTEVIWVGSKHNLAKLQQYDLTLTVGTETVQPVNIVRNLGVWIDHELSMKQHVVKVAGACFHQLRHLRQIRRRVGREVTTRLVLALVMSRLDYCNSLLAGLPASTVTTSRRYCVDEI